MLKSFNLKLLYLSLLLIMCISRLSSSQTMTALANDLAEKIIELNINPNNHLQIIDSLNSNSLFTRSLLIQYCGVQEIIESKYALKLLLPNTPFPENPPYQHSFTERARILYSLVELEDSTIKDELREAIVIMSGDSLNISEISFFARYLIQKFNDDFGWQYIKPYFLRGSSELFGVEVYYLKDFLNSNVRDEVVNVLRNLALTDYQAVNRITAINYLTDVNDEEVVNIITQASFNDPDKMNRFLAREGLKKISYELYLDLLKSALETETEYRLFIYDGLLKSGQPSIYKYVIDLYKSNEYPSDKSLIEDELENQWLLQPKENVAVTVLLDSLSSAVNQLHTFGWIGNQNFIQLLNTYLFNCKNYYQSNDTITSSNQLRLFRTTIDRALRDSTNLTDEFVNQDAWNFLYPQSLFIQQKINSKSLSDSLISLTPASIQAGGSNFNLSIKGSSFNSQSEIYWNGNPLATFFVSDSIIKALVPASNIIAPDDSIMITVSNPVYGLSNALNFKVTSIQQTPNLEVNLKNSLGNQIPASNVTYYENSWKDAVNNGDGTFTVITTKPKVSIRVYYEYASLQADNVTAQNNTYTFQTVNAAVQLKNSLGSLIDQGTVQYYAGAWRTFGTTSNGVAYKELLPINYSFRAIAGNITADKQQDISVNNLVEILLNIP